MPVKPHGQVEPSNTIVTRLPFLLRTFRAQELMFRAEGQGQTQSPGSGLRHPSFRKAVLGVWAGPCSKDRLPFCYACLELRSCVNREVGGPGPLFPIPFFLPSLTNDVVFVDVKHQERKKDSRGPELRSCENREVGGPGPLFPTPFFPPVHDKP